MLAALIFVCIINLLQHPGVLGKPQGHKAVMLSSESSSFKSSDKYAGYLPASEYEFHDRKSKRSVYKRSAGRQVTLPSDVVQSMMDKPVSYFDPSNEINKKMILDCHNKYRSKANPTASNMVKLEWSEEAAKTATAWAKQCVQGHSNMTSRTIPGFRCGENLMMSPYKITWKVVIDSWFSEYADFEFEKGSVNGFETGHYTQLMWGSSALMGCGFAECPNLANKYYYCCHYCPPGNRGVKSIPYKRGKPCGDCPNACSDNLCTNPCPYMDDFSDCISYRKGDTCGDDYSLISECKAMCKCTKGEIK